MGKNEIKIIALPLGLKFLRQFSFPHKLGVMEKLYGRHLRRFEAAWVGCSNGVVWKLDLSNSSNRWIVYGDYEGPVQMGWIRKWLKHGGVVVDSGANIGQMLLYFAPIPGVKVYAFEPNIDESDWLEECLAHQSGWDVEVIKLGLADSNKMLELQCDGPRSTTCLDWYQSQNLKRIEIQLDRLDSLLRGREVDSVRFWKLDVEGGEYEALLGAEHLLSKAAIDAIMIELHPSSYENVVQYMEGMGYQLYQLESAGGLKLVEKPIEQTRNLFALSSKVMGN